MPEDAAEGSQDSPGGLNALGRERYRQGDLEGAAELFRRAVAADPRHFPSRLNLGAVLTRLGRPDEAVGECLKAVELDPSQAKAHFHLANAYFAKSWWEEALTEYEKAVELQGDLAGAHFGLGVLFLNRGWVERAVAAWERYLELEPDSPRAAALRESIAAARAGKAVIQKW